MNERDLIVITAAILLSGKQTTTVSLAMSMAEELISMVEQRQRARAAQRPTGPSISEQRQMGVKD